MMWIFIINRFRMSVSVPNAAYFVFVDGGKQLFFDAEMARLNNLAEAGIGTNISSVISWQSVKACGKHWTRSNKIGII